MKVCNLYKVTFINKTTIRIIAKTAVKAIDEICSRKWNSEINDFDPAEYKEEDITNVVLEASDIHCPDYI